MTRCRFNGPGRVLAVLLLLLPCAALAAGQVDPQLFSGMKWRQVGPFRGGRVVAVSGVPGDPATWYFGAVAGGVWKSTNAGSTWQPVFDEQKIASIGAIAVADSDHNIIYVGTGEACPRGNITYGDGVYKSLDAGKTWQHLGLRDSRHIGAIVVDPRNPDVVFVAALGHAFAPNDERGVFRTDDGGESWMRVNSDHRFRQRAWYYSHIFADPVAPDTVYVLDTGAFRSTNGGKDFELLPAPHGDHHALWIDPRDPRRLINGNDGGATISVDGGKSWTQQYNQPTAQFYHVAVDNHWPYRIYGAQQDNTTIAIASRDDEGVIGRQDWDEGGGGGRGPLAPGPRGPRDVYANTASGPQIAIHQRTGNYHDVTVNSLSV